MFRGYEGNGAPKIEYWCLNLSEAKQIKCQEKAKTTLFDFSCRTETKTLSEAEGRG